MKKKKKKEKEKEKKKKRKRKEKEKKKKRKKKYTMTGTLFFSYDDTKGILFVPNLTYRNSHEWCFICRCLGLDEKVVMSTSFGFAVKSSLVSSNSPRR